MLRSGTAFGNEFRYRSASLAIAGKGLVDKSPRLDGDYLRIDLAQTAGGLGAHAIRATSASEVREALASTRDYRGPVVIVVPVIPHADLPGSEVWWDVAPAEVAEGSVVAALRAEYEAGLADQRWHG